MKITINRMLFVILLFSLMLYGVVAEGITVACLVAAIVMERSKVLRVIDRKYYKACVLFVLSFVIIFFIHILFLNQNTEEIVRLYGLTKNICFPALMLLAFGFLCTEDFTLRIVMLEMTLFNIIYTVAFITRNNMEIVSFQLGSINGCSGISIILVPAAMMYLKSIKINGNNTNNQSLLVYLFIFTSVILVIVSDSSTSKLLLLLEFLAYIFSIIVGRIHFKQNLRGLLILIVLGAIGGSLLIATGRLALDPNELKTRVGIWTRAYNQFSVTKGMDFLFGTGNDIVHMLTKDLEPHNMFLEILLIHGVLGLVLITVFLIYTLRLLLKMELKEFKPIFLSLTVYLTVCCLHPFFTGSTLFQFNCVTGLMFMLMLGKTNQMKFKFLIGRGRDDRQ